MKNIITNYSEYIKENNNEWIIVYHRSNFEHDYNTKFDLSKSDDEYSVFGKAFYFASSGNISSQLGKTLHKFKIRLEKPTLNLNDEISNDEANKLLERFLNKYKLKINYWDKENDIDDKDTYDFNDDYNGVQYGEFFLQIQDIVDNGNSTPNVYYYDFIRNELGYNSFKHFSDYGTNFITEKGDYGYTYGIYNPDDIIFIESF